VTHLPSVAMSLALLSVSCAGVPKQISAVRYCELASSPMGSAVNATEIGIIPGPNGRAYIEVWSALPLTPDYRIYYASLHEFEPSKVPPCFPKG
jgi:hypothetical protein